MILKGGKYLGEGTYGCVFFPSIQCHNKNEQKEIFKTGVSKVFKKKSHMDEELQETKKIDNMDKQGLYTNKALGNCEIKINNFTNKDNKSCKKITKYEPFYHQILYQHKGIDLNNFMKKSYSLPQTFNYILNLMKGIQLLIKNRYIHLDLKPPNILISDSNKALLIDFGLGRDFKSLYDLSKSDYLLEYNYIWYAPEFRFFYDLFTDPLDIGYKKRFIQFNKSKYYGKYSDEFIRNEISDLLMTLQKDMPIAKYHSTANYFVENFAHKADVFALGMVMYFIEKNAKNNNNKNIYGKLLQDIINKALRLNPYKRATIDELIYDLELLIQNTPVEALKPITINNKPNNVNVINPINQNNIKTSSSQNQRVNECMKNKKPELNVLVDKYKLPKNLKQLNKKPLCEKLIEHIEKDKNVQAHPITSTKVEVTFENCMKYYLLSELKQEVSNNKLPNNLKQLHKPELCKELLPYLKNKSNQKTIKRGPKQNKK